MVFIKENANPNRPSTPERVKLDLGKDRVAWCAAVLLPGAPT